MNKIDFCEKCKKRKFDSTQGIVCGLTNEKPGFIDTCPHYEPDGSIIEYKGFDLRPNEQRANTLLFFMWTVLVLEIISLISSGLQYNLLQSASNGAGISSEAATANDLREQIISIIYLIAYICSGIVFIMWFRRAYYNLHQRVNNLSYTEGWAAGGWFVPIASFYIPFKIMKELYNETRSYFHKKDDSLHVDLPTKFLGIWWTLWILNGILSQIVFRLSRNADTLSGLMSVTILDMISESIGIVLALITIKIIKDYSKIERLFQTK